MTDTTVSVDGRAVRVSNLDKVLYPQAGTTKAEVIGYYAEIAPTMLPHLRDRPVTLRRFPDGSGSAGFYAKNVPAGTPDWVRRVRLPSPGSTMGRDTITYVLLSDVPSLVWAANLAALEIHVPQWRVDEAGQALDPDLLVVDLDPGAPAGMAECCTVALAVRELLAADGLAAWPKTSGSKGLQLMARLPSPPAEAPRAGDAEALVGAEAVSAYARGLAQQLERALPQLVVSRMTKVLRPGKVLVDWSQNSAAKTTVAPYSLRARPTPTVSTPVTWQEVTDAAAGAPLGFTAPEVLRRVAAHGDLLGALL